MSVKLRVISLAALASLVAVPALAQSRPQTPPPCGPRNGVLEALNNSFNETPIGRGLTGDGKVFELLLSPSGSWTVLLTMPNGQTCFATAGESWEKIDGNDSVAQGIRNEAGLAKARKLRFLEVVGP